MFKQLRNTLLVKTGFVARKRKQNLTPRILFYHGVSDTNNPLVEGLHIAPEAFSKHLLVLQKYYEIISIDEFYERWKEHRFTGKEVTLTFDDGYKNNLTVLAPILQKSDIPFTVFISTQHMDTGKRFATFIGRAVCFHPTLFRICIPEINAEFPLHSIRQRKKALKAISYQLKHSDIKKADRIACCLVNHLSPEEYQNLCDNYQADAPMNWEEAEYLQKNYKCTIGSHCIDHFICSTFQNDAEIERQIIESKKKIEEKLNTPCHYLAYPNGNTCETALAAAKKAGYRLAFTTDYKNISVNTSPFCMPRYGVKFDLDSFTHDLAYKPR